MFLATLPPAAPSLPLQPIVFKGVVTAWMGMSNVQRVKYNLFGNETAL